MSQIKTTVVSSQIKRYCEIAYDAGLYHPQGAMKDWFRCPSNLAAIAIAFDEKGQAMGCCALLELPVLWGEEVYNFGIWVPPFHRLQGIGTELIKQIKKRDNRQLLVQHHSCPKFFDKVA